MLCDVLYHLHFMLFQRQLTEFNEAQDTDPWQQIGNLCWGWLHQQFLSWFASGYFVYLSLLEGSQSWNQTVIFHE